MPAPEQMQPADLVELRTDQLAAMGLPAALSRSSIDQEADQAILGGLSTVPKLYDEHLRNSTIWYPSLMVPHDKDWGVPYDIAAKGELEDRHRLWTPEDSPLPEAVRVA